jgi:hypothetical protein
MVQEGAKKMMPYTWNDVKYHSQTGQAEMYKFHYASTMQLVDNYRGPFDQYVLNGDLV